MSASVLSSAYFNRKKITRSHFHHSVVHLFFPLLFFSEIFQFIISVRKEVIARIFITRINIHIILWKWEIFSIRVLTREIFVCHKNICVVVGDVWKLFYENVMVVLWGAYNNNYNFSKKNTSNWFPSNKSKKKVLLQKRDKVKKYFCHIEQNMEQRWYWFKHLEKFHFNKLERISWAWKIWKQQLQIVSW